MEPMKPVPLYAVNPFSENANSDAIPEGRIRRRRWIVRTPRYARPKQKG